MCVQVLDRRQLPADVPVNREQQQRAGDRARRYWTPHRFRSTWFAARETPGAATTHRSRIP